LRGIAQMANREQLTFASARFDVYRRPTRRDRFLQQMGKAMPWDSLIGLIAPFYPKEGQPGRPVTPLVLMIKIYFLQIWFNLSDPEAEELMHDSLAVQRFLNLDLGRDRPPDETTINRFRNLIKEHKLGEKILKTVNEHLERAGITIKKGTIVDATVISAPTSTKNERQSRDPEMGSTKKGDQWYFGAKLHVGVDSRTKVIHSVSLTPANVHDSQMLSELLHGGERRVYGDKAYVGQKEAIRKKAPRARRNAPLGEKELRSNRWKSRIRSRVEHVFGVIKHIFGWVKVRYRGIEKNLQYAYGVAAAVNVYIHRRVLSEKTAALSPA